MITWTIVVAGIIIGWLIVWLAADQSDDRHALALANALPAVATSASTRPTAPASRAAETPAHCVGSGESRFPGGCGQSPDPSPAVAIGEFQHGARVYQVLAPVWARGRCVLAVGDQGAVELVDVTELLKAAAARLALRARLARIEGATRMNHKETEA